MRAGVAQLRGARADHVEVAQRRVGQRGRLGLVAQQPLPDQLRLPVRRLRPGRALLGDQVGVRGAVDRGAGGEDDPLDAVRGHPLQQDDGAGDVLGVGVQRAADRDPGVLEAGQVHDTTDVAPVEGLVDRGPVDQGADHQRHVLRHEAAMAAGQVVQHHAVDALVPERPHHVRTDVAGPAGHQPSHGPTLSTGVSHVTATGTCSLARAPLKLGCHTTATSVTGRNLQPLRAQHAIDAECSRNLARPPDPAVPGFPPPVQSPSPKEEA